MKSTKVERSLEMFFFLRFLVRYKNLTMSHWFMLQWLYLCSDKGEDADGNKIGFTEEDVPNFSYDQPPCSFYKEVKHLVKKF